MNQTLLGGMPWIPSHATNVTETWRKHGWKPASEKQDDYELVDSLDWMEKGFHDE